MAYKEGARDHCYCCGRPKREHKGPRRSCPEDRSKHNRRHWAEEEAGERVAPKRPCP